MRTVTLRALLQARDGDLRTHRAELAPSLPAPRDPVDGDRVPEPETPEPEETVEPETAPAP